MHILSVLRSYQRAKLRTAVCFPDRLSELEALEDVFVDFQLSAIDVVIANPIGGDRASHHEVPLGRLISTGLPVVLYVAARNAREILPWIRLGARDLIIEGVDDAPSSISSILRSVHDDVGAAIISALAPRLVCLPKPLEAAVRALFATNETVRSSSALARRVGIPERTLHRRIAAAGLPNVKSLAGAASVSRAYVLLKRRHTTCEQVARSLSYASGRQLSIAMTRIVGQPAATAPRNLSHGEFVHRVVVYLARAQTDHLDPAVVTTA